MTKKKIIFIFFFIIIFYIWKDYKKIDFYYINYPKVTYSYDNLNNNLIKNFHNYFNRKYEKFLLKFSKEHRDYWKENKQSQFKDTNQKYKFYQNKRSFNKSNQEYFNNENNWTRSHGNNNSNRFSSLKQINNSNAHKLKLKWIFKSPENSGDIQANPIVYEGTIFTPISGGYIAALDAVTGKTKWMSEKFGYFAARRGLVLVQGKNELENRIYFSNRERLICLDANNGKRIKSFGGDGDVRTGLNVMTPVIFQDQIIVVTWDHSVESYDLMTGKTKWKIKYRDYIKKRVGSKKYNNLGSNPWGGISLDEKRGLLFLTTGNPHAYFDGTLRPGTNPGSNSVIAVDLLKKKIIWSFQETSHDIWNSDLPAPPILTAIKKNNILIDVVVVPTKRGNTLILDRISGEPIHEFRYRLSPQSNLPGEKTSLYQPDLSLPEPFAKNVFRTSDFWSYDEKKLVIIKKKYENYNYGFYQPYEIDKKNLQYNFNGGAEWMGASINHKDQNMYVTSNNIPWEAWVERIDFKNNIPSYSSFFHRALVEEENIPISKPPWGTITSLNLSTGKINWQIPFGEYKKLIDKNIPRTGTENFGGVTGTEGNVIFATGTLDKKFYVFNSINGKELFSFELPYIGSAPPTTFFYKGTQYVIIHSTGGSTLQQGYPDLVENGNAIVAFSIN